MLDWFFIVWLKLKTDFAHLALSANNCVVSS